MLSAREGFVERGCSCCAQAGCAATRAHNTVAARYAFIVNLLPFGLVDNDPQRTLFLEAAAAMWL